MSWNFLFADMFPYEDSKTVSGCLYPKKRNCPIFVNISPTVVIDRSSWIATASWKPKIMNHDIHKHLSRSLHILSELTTCTFMFPQVYSIEPSFFETTSRMHRHPSEGRHLVLIHFFKIVNCIISIFTE